MNTPLTPQEADRVSDLVAEAAALEPEQRAAFLAQACLGADGLRAEVESLLDFKTKAPQFLASPAFERGIELLGFSAGDDLKPGDMLGEYRVLSLLGSGGMGEVYLADDTVHGRQVALKLIGQGRAEEVRGRHFRHERKVLASLNHPHIARLYGSGVTDKGQAYLVMEYVEGERLDRYCQEQGLDVTARLALFRKVCAAVSYAHQNLVVHRDLKPANIRVTPEGEPKLLDFGIAKLLDPEGTTARLDPTATMQGAMTPEYASPEQIKGEPITTASDVYSLGVVLFELLTGQRPFAHLKGRRADELARAICEEEPPRPSTVATHTAPTTTTAGTMPAGQVPATRPSGTRLRRRLEGDLDNIVAKALRKEPARRYPSVLALTEDIRRHGEGLPVTARKDTLRYRMGKFVRRNKVGAAAAALLTLALLAGLAATTWQAHVARQERDRAREALANAETARKQTQQINNFLQQLLGSASPTKLGKDAKVSQVVDAASATVDQTLANEPEVLAEVHHTLGSTYQGLGMHAAAEQHCEKALALNRPLYGPEDRRTLESERLLARERVKRGRYDEAINLLRHVIDCLRRPPGGREPELAQALSVLAFAFGQTDRFPEAEQAIDEAKTLNARAHGENSLEYAICLGEFGLLLQKEDKLAGAIKMFRQVEEIVTRVAPNAPQVLAAEFNQCTCLVDLDRYAEAGAVLEAMRRDCRRIVGENDNLYYTEVLFYSEWLDIQRGEIAKAAGYSKEVLTRYSAYKPATNFYVKMASYSWA